MSLQVSCIKLLLHKAGLPHSHADTHQCIQYLEDGVHGTPFEMCEAICQPWLPCHDSSYRDLYHLPKFHYAAAMTLSFNTSPFHQTAHLYAFTTSRATASTQVIRPMFSAGQRRRHLSLPDESPGPCTVELHRQAAGTRPSRGPQQ